LLPRLKAIHSKHLYRSETGRPDVYPHLQPVLSKPINWELIRQQYDEIVKLATAFPRTCNKTGDISMVDYGVVEKIAK
jgi:TnpA family transposase